MTKNKKHKRTQKRKPAPARGKLTDGFAKSTSKYDKHGNETERAFFGADGKQDAGAPSRWRVIARLFAFAV